MSRHAAPPPEGARPVARFAEATPVERAYIWTLRSWLDDSVGQQLVWRHYSVRAGARAGAKALSLFERQLSLIAAHARRPLLRHSACCLCLGQDEAALAHMVGQAGHGRLEDAYAAAASVFRPEGILEIVEVSAQLGQALTAVGGEPDQPPQRPPQHRRSIH